MSLYATCRCGIPEGQEGAHRTDCPLYGVTPMNDIIATSDKLARRMGGRFVTTDPVTDTPGTLDERLRDYAANGSRAWQGIEAVFTEAADEIASLRARVEALEKLHRSNASTMEEQRSRMIRWGKSHEELNAAINETRQALNDTPG